METLIREHQRSYTPKSWVVIPSDMPKEYNDYSYWNAPYFLNKASGIGAPQQFKAVIDAVIKKFKYPVQSSRSCFGIQAGPALLTCHIKMCCEAARKANRCNYTYISNTISAFRALRQRRSRRTRSRRSLQPGVSIRTMTAVTL